MTALDDHRLARTKVCPDCAEDVRERARICRYCGYNFESEEPFEDDEEPLQSEPRRPSRWKALALVVIILFVLWLLSLASYTPQRSVGDASSASQGPGAGDDTGQTAQQASTTTDTDRPVAAAASSAGQLLRSGNPHACSAPAVKSFISAKALESIDTIYGTERAPKLKSRFQISVAEIGETSVDRATGQMGCSANVHITDPGGMRAVLVQYTLQPSLDSDDDVLISADWRAVQNVVANTLAFEQFLGSGKATDPNVVAQ